MLAKIVDQKTRIIDDEIIITFYFDNQTQHSLIIKNGATSEEVIIALQKTIYEITTDTKLG